MPTSTGATSPRPASDVRNVRSALGPEAAAAFGAAYGPVDPLALALDALGVLIALHEAARRERPPSWAEPLVRQVRDGGRERMVRAAMAAI